MHHSYIVGEFKKVLGYYCFLDLMDLRVLELTEV